MEQAMGRILFLKDNIGNLLTFPSRGCTLDPFRKEVESKPYISSSREPVHVPFAGALDIADDELKAVKVQCRDSVKAHVE